MSAVYYYILVSDDTATPQLVSLVPVAWYGQDGVGARPLEGLVRYTVHLADCLSRAAAGQNDLERSITRLVSLLSDLSHTVLLEVLM